MFGRLKPIFRTAAVLLLCNAAACSVNEIQPCQDGSRLLRASLERPTINAYAQARTTLANGDNVVWSAGDAINVMSSASNERFTLTSGAGSSVGAFDGGKISESEHYYAFYPYSSSVSFDAVQGRINFSLPSSQTYSESSFGTGANPAVASFDGSEGMLSFRNLCGVLAIMLRGMGAVTAVEVEDASGAPLCGNYALETQYMCTPLQNVRYLGGGSSKLTLDCGAGVPLGAEPVEFDIVVPVGAFQKGFNAEIHFSDGTSTVLSTDKAQLIFRSDIHQMEQKAVVAESSYNLENKVVSDYLDYLETHPYKDGDYSYTYIDKYYDLTTSYRKDWPSPVSVVWDNSGSALQSQELVLSENSSFEPSVSYSLSTSADSYDLYNLIPGCKYWFKVVGKAQDGTVVKFASSSFTTSGRIRFLRITNICNVRDLGGIPTADGSKRIKYGLMFRSGEMNGTHLDSDNKYCVIDAEGKKAFKLAGVTADLDLRKSTELNGITSSPIGSGVDFKNYSSASDYIYDAFWTSDTYIKIFQWLINELKAGRSVDFHCVYGADRTATLAFLIEALLGVSENWMSIDYELSSFSYRSDNGLRMRGPKNLKSSVRYRQMLEGVLTSSKFTGATVQKKIYNFLKNGYPGASSSAKISTSDLDWFISNMLEAR